MDSGAASAAAPPEGTSGMMNSPVDAAPEPALRSTARAASDAVLRGVVAADRLD